MAELTGIHTQLTTLGVKWSLHVPTTLGFTYGTRNLPIGKIIHKRNLKQNQEPNHSDLHLLPHMQAGSSLL